VKRDDYVLEENHVLVTQGHCEAADDTGQDVEQFCGAVELVGLVDETEEALVDCLANHLAAGHQLGIQLVQNVLKIVTLNRLFRVKQFKEFLHELRSNVHFKAAHFDCLVDH